jgi:hypothetical protein
VRLEHVRAKNIFFEERSMCNEPIKLRAYQKIRLKGPLRRAKKGHRLIDHFLLGMETRNGGFRYVSGDRKTVQKWNAFYTVQKRAPFFYS